MTDTLIYVAIALGQIVVSIIPIVIAIQASKYKRNQKGQFEKKSISGLKMAGALLVITIIAAIFTAFEAVKSARETDRANRETVKELAVTSKQTKEVQEATDTLLKSARRSLGELATIDEQENTLKDSSLATLNEQRKFKVETSSELNTTSHELMRTSKKTDVLMSQSSSIAENVHRSLLTQQRQVAYNDVLLGTVTKGINRISVVVDKSNKTVLAATEKSTKNDMENTMAVAYASQQRKLPIIKTDAPITIMVGGQFLKGPIQDMDVNWLGPFKCSVSKDNELFISGELRDSSGSYAVHIINSEIKTEIGLRFDINSDEDALEVVNRSGKPVLQLLVSGDRRTLFITYARLDVSQTPPVREIATATGNTIEVYNGGDIDLGTPCIFAYPGVRSPGKRLRSNAEIFSQVNKPIQISGGPHRLM